MALSTAKASSHSCCRLNSFSCSGEKNPWLGPYRLRHPSNHVLVSKTKPLSFPTRLEWSRARWGRKHGENLKKTQPYHIHSLTKHRRIQIKITQMSNVWDGSSCWGASSVKSRSPTICKYYVGPKSPNSIIIIIFCLHMIHIAAPNSSGMPSFSCRWRTWTLSGFTNFEAPWASW